MPDTSGLPTAEAARIRSSYRARMAIRWRNKAARAEDKRLKRLPANWHDWMHCPSKGTATDPLRGYQGPGCTCDSWDQPKQSKRLGTISSRITLPADEPRTKQPVSKVTQAIDFGATPFIVVTHGCHT